MNISRASQGQGLVVEDCVLLPTAAKQPRRKRGDRLEVRGSKELRKKILSLKEPDIQDEHKRIGRGAETYKFMVLRQG